MSNTADFVFKLVNETVHPIFLTGKAGTGKTTLLRKITAECAKNLAVVAPTGIAALNAGGVTIHSFFQIAPATFLPDYIPIPAELDSKLETKASLLKKHKISSQKLKLMRSLELLIIDEVSMLRADLLDAIDFVLKEVRRSEEPMGGVQVLFIGDVFQLPPVVRPMEKMWLQNYYKGDFFFHAHVFKQLNALHIELTHIYRQKDSHFIEILNQLRNNNLQYEQLKQLNEKVKNDFNERNGYITLTTHNDKADKINLEELAKLPGKIIEFSPEVQDDFPEYLYPIEKNLLLKEGAQVMFIKNDISHEKRFYNGKTGIIKHLSKNEITVYFPDDKLEIDVEKYEWFNKKYKLNERKNEIEEEVLGTYVQYPLRLAWAITVHKSQGLTFDKAVLDVKQVFAPGQLYVALSRLRSLDGLVLTENISQKGIQNNFDVVQFSASKTMEDEYEQLYGKGKSLQLKKLCRQTFDFSEIIKKLIELKRFSKSILEKENKKLIEKIIDQEAKLIEIQDAAQKFDIQLEKVFAYLPIDLDFLNNRTQKAHAYFTDKLYQIEFQVLKSIHQLKSIKKTKGIVDEILPLDELLTTKHIQLNKTRFVLNRFCKSIPTLKQDFASQNWNDFRNELIQTIEKEGILISVDLKTSVKKKASESEEKKNTYLLTLELYHEGKSILEISKMRKLSEGTIFSHFVKLIEMKTVSLHKLMGDEEFSALQNAFEHADVSNMGLAGMMEYSHNQFTFNQCKLYKAHIQSLKSKVNE
jgi:DNA-binding transcriptional MerR regulator